MVVSSREGVSCLLTCSRIPAHSGDGTDESCRILYVNERRGRSLPPFRNVREEMGHPAPAATIGTGS